MKKQMHTLHVDKYAGSAGNVDAGREYTSKVSAPNSWSFKKKQLGKFKSTIDDERDWIASEEIFMDVYCIPQHSLVKLYM